ncbi:MAG: nucleotidyltransferase domain-containing protein [Caryophanon sp.]|nr:nucleotidyltransferase domain-containing protein [Caryophanon sp.]
MQLLHPELQQQLIACIKQHVQPDFILLFGSFAKGTARDDSDIDLAYFSKQQLSSYERFLLAGELAGIAGREVDLIDIKQIDTVFTMQIFEQGIPIDICDENEFIRQRMRAYSMYATLYEQRAPMIAAIQKRGSVFGNE